MNKKLLKRILLILAILLAAVYVGVQVYNLFRPGIKTETATHATVTDSVRVEGLVVRKEKLLENTTSGVISYEVSDGTKVAKNGVIASSYASAEAATAESQRVELKNELDKLENLNKSVGTTAVNPDNVSKQIYQRLYSLKTDINDYNLSKILSDRTDTLNLINQWQMATGKTKTFSERIQSLKEEVAALDSQSSNATGTIRASAAGYFVKKTDGYENVYDYDDVKQLTVEDLKEQREPKAVSENTIGKVCEQFDWYIACVVPADTAIRVAVGDQISVSLPFVTSAEVPAKVVAVNQTDVDSEAALILRCSYMDSTLANIRNETVLLNIGTFDGIKISQNAIHFETVTGEISDSSGSTTTETREVKGVYVVEGSELKFVQVVPMYSTGNYVICDPEPDPGELLTEKTISLYDTVAIGGNLYDGKSVG
ncbi:MAG: HlyD family efflux transporter periplasmic adaptor subunit [Oscillospiraceae bacterium]|nr:HlyD family efflux transporter periplasmic adaptor subunit [Oscillospiraceae bacterium]